MNIVMPALHSTPSFDPFSSSSPYPNYQETALFQHQEHFTHFTALPPSLFSPDSSQQQQQQVDPMWLSGYPAHGHIQQQQQPLHIIPPSPSPATNTTSDFLSEDVILNDPLAKSTAAPSSAPATTTTATTTSTETTTTTFAGPPIAIGSRPTRPLPRRFHSLSTTMQRRATAEQAQTNNNSRFSRQPAISRFSPQKSHSPPAFSSYATHSHSSQSPPDPNDSSRATKRRRTNDSVLHQQPYSTASTSPMHAMTPTHLHDHHGFGTTQTWAGPPTGHIASATAMHPITGHHHHPPGLTTAAAQPHWSSVGVHPYYPTDPSQHAYHELSPDGVIHTPMLPFESPASHHSGSPFYASPQQAGSPSSGSVHSYVKKTEPGSPRLNPDAASDVFDHPPTDFPPRPYPGGPNVKSPWAPVRPVGKIFGSRLEQMPAIEKRLAKLEENLDQYLDVRAAQALKNSQLPGLSFDSPPIQAKPTGPSRLFGGRIWPTALARRVRRTPRD